MLAPPSALSDTLPRPQGRTVFAADDAGTLAPEVAEDRPLVYVPHNRSGDVWEIDPVTYEVVAKFAAGREIQHVVPSYDLDAPGFPETFLSGVGALWLEGSQLRVMLLPGVPGSLVLVEREPVEAFLDAVGVVLMRVILSRGACQDASVSSRSRMPSKIFWRPSWPFRAASSRWRCRVGAELDGGDEEAAGFADGFEVAVHLDGSSAVAIAKHAARRGTNVCDFHGAKAPQVKRKVRQRIEEAADRMARELLRMATDDNVADSVKLAAIRDALDRAGISAKTAVSVEVGPPKPYEAILERIEAGSRADYRRSLGRADDSDDPHQTLADSPRALDAADDDRIVDAEPIQQAGHFDNHHNQRKE